MDDRNAPADADAPDFEAQALDADLEELQQHSVAVRKFYSDPEFAYRAMEQRAASLGMKLVPRGEAEMNVPPQILRSVERTLSPELQWMAPSLASSILAAAQEMMPAQAPKPKPQKPRPLAKGELVRPPSSTGGRHRDRHGNEQTDREAFEEAARLAMQHVRRRGR